MQKNLGQQTDNQKKKKTVKNEGKKVIYQTEKSSEF